MTIKLEVLNTALELLKGQDSRPKNSVYHGVCQALSDAGFYHAGGRAASKSLMKLINSRLGGSVYLHNWLYYRCWLSSGELDDLIFKDSAKAKALRAKLKATRIAWLKSLIKEHECKPTKKSSRPSA